MPHAAPTFRAPLTPRPAAARLACALLAAVAQCSGGRAAEPETFARVEARADTGVRRLDGRIVIEAADGGLLLELPDQRYEVLQPDAIIERGPLPGGQPDEQPRDLGRRVLADLPPGFDLHVSRHYVICFNTSREYAKWVAAVFERLHEAFTNTWKNAGLEVASPRHPLIVVIFADRSDYEAFATRDVGPAADRVIGYYNLASNRVTTFDLTGSDALRTPDRPSGRAGLDILASPAAAGLVSTLVHEATHQMAFNTGMHRRLAPVPLWVSEGIATYFETPDLNNVRGWRGVGAVNRPRLDHFLRSYQPGCVAAMIRDDEAFRDPDRAVDCYATAWAVCHHLLQVHKPEFVAYLRGLAEKQPLDDDSADQRLAAFEAAFGDPAAVERGVVAAMARLASRPP